jgi:enoyl-CoA hydratase
MTPIINTDTMTPSDLIVTRSEGSVAVVELNRPKKRNALSQYLINELIRVLSQMDRDATVHAVVLTGSGQGPFCGTSPKAHSERFNNLSHACSWSGS